jgi:hypothetical protein
MDCDNCSVSFVKMSSAKVLDMATLCLERINNKCEEEKKKYIETYRKIIMNGWWHRLFNKPVPTDEEVIEYMDNNYTLYSYIDCKYRYQRNIAKRLKKACQINASDLNTDIYVSTEDLYWL